MIYNVFSTTSCLQTCTPEPLKAGYACNSVITELLHNHLHRQLGYVCIQMPSNRCIGIFLTSRAWDFGPFQWEAGKLQGPAAAWEADGTSWTTVLMRNTASAFGTAQLSRCPTYACDGPNWAGRKNLTFVVGCAGIWLLTVHTQSVLQPIFLPYNQLAAVPKRMTPCDT